MATPNQKAWTEAEKMVLLLGILESQGWKHPKWSDLPLPKGRTTKAAQRIWENLLKTPNGGYNVEMENDGQVVVVGRIKDDAGDNSAPKTPRKRKANDEEGSRANGNGTASETPKSQKKTKANNENA